MSTTATRIRTISLVCVGTPDQDKAVAFYESIGFEKRTTFRSAAATAGSRSTRPRARPASRSRLRPRAARTSSPSRPASR